MMNDGNTNPPTERLDAAVAQRLAKLRGMPVDATPLSAALEAEIPRPVAKSRPRHLWLRRLRAVAASVIVAGLIAALIVGLWSRPALASIDRLLQIHQEILAGTDHTMAVDSIDSANTTLAQQWPGAPALPAVPHDKVMACCVHRIGRQKAACAMLKVDGVAVTMAIADAADIRMPEAQIVQSNGHTYHVQSAQNVNMAMTQRDGRWACLMGQVPTERLVAMLDTLQW